MTQNAGASILYAIGGAYAVIIDAVNRLPRRMSEGDLNKAVLARAVEYRLLRVFAISGGIRWASVEEVAAAIEKDAEHLDTRAWNIADDLAGDILADATIRFMPGVSPHISIALFSVIFAIREGLQLWTAEQPESAERMLACGLMRLMNLDAQTSEDAHLAGKTADRVLSYLEADMGDLMPQGLLALLREVFKRRTEWRHAEEVEP